MKRFLFLCFILFSNLLYSQQTIWAVLIADTITEVKHSSKSDLGKMQVFLKTLQKDYSLKLKMKTLTGKNARKSAIRSWLKECSSQSDDIFIFYYTGHGYRFQNKSSQWPSLYLAAKDESLDMDSYLGIIHKKDARLKIVLLDCCNNYTTPELLQVEPIKFSTQKVRYSKKLFKNYSGTIIASASSPGEVALATRSGSTFTNSFLKSLERESFSDTPSWDNVFSNTHKTCRKLQKPQYLLKLNNRLR